MTIIYQAWEKYKPKFGFMPFFTVRFLYFAQSTILLSAHRMGVKAAGTRLDRAAGVPARKVRRRKRHEFLFLQKRQS
ncbi:MAG: hypothetical protein IKP72_07260, partial [Clostridia bacterium]|nr:hypothetical protein [Clostridia bacterium]